jgi:diphthamide synthase subunit DPH2
MIEKHVLRVHRTGFECERVFLFILKDYYLQAKGLKKWLEEEGHNLYYWKSSLKYLQAPCIAGFD